MSTPPARTTPITRQRQELLADLQRQLPLTRGPLRSQTERAIRQIETELTGGRAVAAEAATK